MPAIFPQASSRSAAQPAHRSLATALFAKTTDKAVILGLRLATPHTNSRGLIHGGLIAALADDAMGYSCAHRMGGKSSLVTVGLAVDFIGSAKIGQWLAIESDVIKTGSTICFAQCLVDRRRCRDRARQCDVSGGAEGRMTAVAITLMPAEMPIARSRSRDR